MGKNPNRTSRKVRTKPGANGVVEILPFEFLDRLADLVPPPAGHNSTVENMSLPRTHFRTQPNGLSAQRAASRSLPIRGRSGRSSRTSANRSNRRRSRPLVGRPPTGANSCRCMTTATSFNRRLTSCPTSTSTASDRCHMPGHNKAAGPPDSERLRADTRKTPLQRGKAGGQGKAWCAPGDWSTRLTSRSSARSSLRTCHWPGYPSQIAIAAAHRFCRGGERI